MGVFHGARERSFTIKRPKSDQWPKNFCALAVFGRYAKKFQEYAGRAPEGLYFGELKEWQCCFLDREKDKFRNRLWFDGNDYSGFWINLRNQARKNGTIWVIGWRMWPAWCLLQGKREIDEQRLLLDIRSGEDTAEAFGKKPRKPQGLFVAENPPTIICLQVPGGGRIKMIDLANYGILEEDLEAEEEEGKLSATIVAIKSYYQLCKTYDMGSMQTTAASQAWYCFRRSHMSQPVTVHPMEKVLALEQAAYYGGRCECVRIGRFQKKLYHLDVNSMYTALGLLANFPFRHKCTWNESDNVTPPMPSFMAHAVADVTIKTINNHWPARESVKKDPFRPPARRSGRERIIYPVGEFRTALCGPELFHAMDMGVIQKWHRIQYYECSPVMRDWSQWALMMRATLKTQGFGHMARCAKKIMNSLPGKWGQRNKRWVDWVSPDPEKSKERNQDEWFQEWGLHPNGDEMTPYRTIAGQTQYQDREELCMTSCPSIAGFWTSYGRQFLLGAIIHCGLEHVYYYDTDSLIVDQEGYDRMNSNSCCHQLEPLKWKVKEVDDDVEILGIRRYRFGPRWCVAGPFGGVVTGSGSPGEFVEHEGFGHQLWHRSVGDPVEIKRIVRWQKNYHHGHVDNDGIVWPFFAGCDLPSEINAVECK